MFIGLVWVRAWGGLETVQRRATIPYMYREREIDRYTPIITYIYIYNYSYHAAPEGGQLRDALPGRGPGPSICVYIYIYIYIYVQRER